ncbi:MAG: penicillin acylase family protein [Candidatus Sigynarchaeum springense]
MKRKLKDIIRLLLAAGIASSFIVALSIPLGPSIPAIGNLVNPYGGFWSIDHQTPAMMNVDMPFLSGQVTVIKDAYGEPHIYAQKEIDAVAVLGYLHGRDRMFQLEMIRRQASGLLAEVVGTRALDIDKYYRNIRLKSAGENLTAWVKVTDPAMYAKLEKYVAGINYAIDTCGTLPLEFHLLGIRPAHWTAEDCLTIEKIMDNMLTFGTDDVYRTLLREGLEDAGYTSAMDELFPLVTPFQKPITVDYGNAPGERPISPFSAARPEIANLEAISSWVEWARAASPVPARQGFGSNNWVVSGSKSATGFPILCNDMHLEWSLPMIWYVAHVKALDSGMNCQGFTLPGAPLVIVGHNEHVAWGMTNAGCDHVDWYSYTANSTHYLYKGTWYPFGKVTEMIPVKGRSPVSFTIRSTIHGVVMDNGNLPYDLTGSEIGTVLAFRWVALVTNTTTFKAVYGFNKARNITEFDEALEYFALPSQNVVYADRYGNISIRCSGWVPFREGVNATHDADACRFVLNGTAGEHEWNGTFIPFDKLPHSVNPAQGYLASANQLSAGSLYPYYFQDSMDPGYRARRINDLLATDPSVSVDDMAAIQNDVYDKSAEWLLPVLLRVFDNDTTFPAGQKTLLVNQSVAILRAWNASTDRCKMLKDLAAPTIFAAILDKYQALTFDEFAAYGILPALNVLENLTLNVPASKWFDTIATSGTTEKCSDIIREAIKQGVAWLAASTTFSGKAPAEWTYGLAHKVYWHHLAYLDALAAGPYTASGSGITPNPSYAPLFEHAYWGASERMIIDFSRWNHDFDTSRMVIPGGSSGDPVSPHYTDQLQLFLRGEYHGLAFHQTADAFPAGTYEARWTFT